MDIEADHAKVLAAYRIINEQFAKNTQKLKADLHLYEKRYVMTSEMLLQTRQENKALRDMVRKLKDQIQMVTGVMMSMQQQSSKMFNMINQPHVLAEGAVGVRTPQAQQVFDRRRAENSPFIDEMAIQEEEERCSKEASVREKSSTSFDVDTGNSKSGMGMDTSGNIVINEKSSDCWRLTGSSPLIQRFKRRSKNACFDESFETVDHERLIMLPRNSQERRRIYANLADGTEEHLLTIRPECSDRLTSNIRDTEIDEPEFQTPMENNDSTMNDSSNGLDNTQCDPADSYNLANNSEANKLVVSTRVPTGQIGTGANKGRCTETDSSSDEEHTTLFDPSDFITTCSTPNSSKIAAARNRICRAATVPSKLNIDTVLYNPHLRPVVVLHPLTIDNFKTHEQGTKTSKRRGRLPSKKQNCKIEDDSSGEWNTGSRSELEPSSSTETCCIKLNESGRPRRKAAPTTLRESSLITKLRRD